jgi:class 3 adenylate cyclase
LVEKGTHRNLSNALLTSWTSLAFAAAWSSTREPSQVFILLETIYGHFDDVAKRRRVFKVETIGDCYVAVVGLPTPRKDHAVVMVRFASECLKVFFDVTKKLEIELGPDTVSIPLTAR